jgi:hypothetical protein
MSDEIPAPVPPIDVETIMARWAAHAQRAAELHPVNKASLFAALAAADITRVTVRFDGSGDSGQIEDIEVLAGEEAIALPTTTVEIAMPDYHQEVPEILSQPLRDAIETLSYAFLQETHAGWENNEGGYGDFVFDVAAGTITLDYNERIETSENYSHEF